MMSDANPQNAENSVRDAAALLLAYIRKDIDMIQAINENSNLSSLLSGLLFVTGMVMVNTFEEDALETTQSLVDFYATVPADFWDTMASNAHIIGAKETN